MTDAWETQVHALKEFLSGSAHHRVVVLRSPAGRGLTTLLARLQQQAPASAIVLDDAQRRPRALAAGVRRLAREPGARLLAGYDMQDDHPACVVVPDELGSLRGDAVTTQLEPLAASRLAAMVREVAPDTAPALTARIAERADMCPGTLGLLLTAPPLTRRIRDGCLLMHPDEIGALPATRAELLRTPWVRLSDPERQLVAAVWVAGGRVASRPLNEHLRASGWDPVASVRPPWPWLTEDGGELWLGKHVGELLRSLPPSAPIVLDMREALTGLRQQVARPVAKPPAPQAGATREATRRPKQTTKRQPEREPKGSRSARSPATRQEAKPPPASKPTVTEGTLLATAKAAEARSDFAAAEDALRRRVELIQHETGPRSGPAFAARRRVAKLLVDAGDRARGLQELESLAAATEAARGPNDSLVCDILFELGIQGVLTGDDRGLEWANEAVRRLTAGGREEEAKKRKRALTRAVRRRAHESSAQG